MGTQRNSGAEHLDRNPGCISFTLSAERVRRREGGAQLSPAEWEVYRGLGGRDTGIGTPALSLTAL